MGYRILRGAAGAPLSQLVQIGTTEEIASYTATNLKANTAYQFAALALDPSNNLSSPRTVTFTTSSSSDTTAPAAPSSSSVSAKVFSSTRIDLVWAASISLDISGYQIFRDGALVGEVDLPLRRYYSDNGLAPASIHSYQVRTIDFAGNVSALTTGRSATTTASGVVKIVRGPYIQSTTTNSTLIAWWTNIPSPSVVNYGLGSLSAQVSDPVLTLQHVMLIGGLNAGTSYQYQVVSNTASSATLTFSTAALPGATFQFAAVGDFGGGSPQETTIANKIATGGAQLIQTLGDNVYPEAADPNFATTYSDFDARFYIPYAAAMGQQTLWLAAGNHEYYGNEAFWRNIWMPNNERWYSYDWGDAHILVLDAEQPYLPGTPQYQFAQADLMASQSKTWRIVIVPRPPYSSSTNNSSAIKVRTYLVPLFEQQNVQLVLAGNSHNYERTYPLIGGVPQASGGVTYIVSGGGGNGLNSFAISQPSWSAFRQSTYEYVRLTVSANSLQLDAINDSGTIFDSATITPALPPSEASIDALIGGNDQGIQTVNRGQSLPVSYPNVNDGPVKIVSTNNVPVLASERVIYTVNGIKTSFSEMRALPNGQLDNTYWLPWYNNVDLDTQLRFGNVSCSTATVHVLIGGAELNGSPFTIAAGASTRKSFTGVNDGPVEIVSNVNIVAAERVIYTVHGTQTSFTEMMALANNQLDTTYWLPWYNNVDLDTQLRFGNVSGSTATVHVYIGGQEMTGSPFALAAGVSTRKSFTGVNNGPVKIVSNVNIVAAERVIYTVNGTQTSFSEMMAQPNSELDTTYWLPWYNNANPAALDTQLRVGNVTSSGATVHVYIGGAEMVGSPFILAPGASTRVNFAGVNTGPVKVVSDENIVVAERFIYKTGSTPVSFSEMMALPNKQVDTTYWLPWYNNIDLDTQLRFGVP